MTRAPHWRIAAASSIGTSHLGSGLPCQDAHRHRLIRSVAGEFLVTVVSDGAGSAAHSDIASSMTVAFFAEAAESFIAEGGKVSELDRHHFQGWLAGLIVQIEARAAELGHSVRDYACTLLVAFVAQDAAAFMQLGDGAIVVSHGTEDGWSYIFWPQHGEYANTTNFVVSPNATELFEFEMAPRRIDELALFSDGIEKLVLHDASKSVHGPFFDRMFPPVRSAFTAKAQLELSAGLERYLASPAICERTDDDKTLVLASRVPKLVAQAVP